MKRNGLYRYSLQFPALSEQQLAVGEALEKMGNRKSSIIVNVFKYLEDHPDLNAAKATRAKREKNKPRDPRSLPPHKASDSPESRPDPVSCDSPDDGIVAMLDNLSLFN